VQPELDDNSERARLRQSITKQPVVSRQYGQDSLRSGMHSSRILALLLLGTR